MRVVYTLFFLLTIQTVQAQETLITKTKIPLGLQVRHIETDSLIDISKLCDGFDENNVPINLIVPAYTNVSLFLPYAERHEDIAYYSMDTSRYSTTITPNALTESRPKLMALKYEYDFEYKGRKVLKLIDSQLAGRAKIQYSLVKMTLDSEDNKHYSDTTHIYFESEMEPRRVQEIFLDKEIVDHITRIDARNEMVELLRTSYSWFNTSVYPPRTYEDWRDAGYSSEEDSTLLPTNPMLPYNENYLFFSFIRFVSADKITLTRNGTDIPITREMFKPNNLLALEDLRSGSYELSIDNSEATYNKSTSIYQFTIKSSFWHQGGYWLAILLPLIVILFLIYRTYTQAKLNKLYLTQQITDAELKAIRAQLNPHFLFNALSAIQNLVNKGDQENANSYIVKLSRLMRLVLNRSSESFHSLANELEIAELYLELENLRSQFSYEIQVGEGVNMNMLVPSMLLQPYLENAVVHGIQANGGNQIQLQIDTKGVYCTLTILDNGKGTSSKNGNGKGMSMSSERLKVIEHRHGIETSVNARTTDKGYEVIIKLPTDL